MYRGGLGEAQFLPIFEIALVLVRLDYVPSMIVKRITCERLLNLAKLMALLIAVGPAYHSGLYGSTSEIRLTPR
jgi:hypothetical protein